MLRSHEYDNLSFVETYLTCDDTSAKLLNGANDEYVLFRCDRSNRIGGGVVIYCKSVLNPVRLPLPEAINGVDAVCIDLKAERESRILVVYRPPNCTPRYHDDMCNLITHFTLYSDDIIIFGDFNLP